MPFITVPDGTHLYYEELGAGEPLLLISGQGLNHTFWNGVRDDFASRYRVIVYDHRGTGQSDKPSDPPYSTRRFAQDAVWLLDSLEMARVHVYGHSMGGMIGQWLGITHANRVGALVLGATTPGNLLGATTLDTVHGVPRSAETVELLTNPPADQQEAFAKIGALYFSPTWITAHLDVVKELFQITAIPEYAARLHYQATQEHDTWELLPTISAPTLIIHGSEDQVVPAANASLLAERIPGAELSFIKNGRHNYTLEFREEASRVVNEFLARHPLE
jgi:pimeloyl-ACP methyl ester carboxylesterase